MRISFLFFILLSFPAIDECKQNTGLCEFGKCSNIPGGSFKCTCNENYVPVNDGKRCVGKLWKMLLIVK